MILNHRGNGLLRPTPAVFSISICKLPIYMSKREREGNSPPKEEACQPRICTHRASYETVASRAPPRGSRLPRLPLLLLTPSAGRPRRPAQIDHQLVVATRRGGGRRGNTQRPHHLIAISEQLRRRARRREGEGRNRGRCPPWSSSRGSTQACDGARAACCRRRHRAAASPHTWSATAPDLVGRERAEEGGGDLTGRRRIC
jgi:hypothetical protein